MPIRFPNEGELPCAVLLAWPHEATDWQPWLTQVDACYGEVVSRLSHHAKVILLCRHKQHQSHIEERLSTTNALTEAIQYVPCKYNDTWVRDYGPLTILKDRHISLLNFQFNAWGGKYTAAADNAVNNFLKSQNLFHADLIRLDIIMEGGSIDTDGQGTLITTSQCLITDTRNAAMQKQDWEQLFSQRLGIQQTLWLDHGGLIGDDTDSHVDMLARFCNAETIAYTSCDDKSDIHFQPLLQMKQQLELFRTLAGKPYQLVALPLPKAIMSDGERLPASYANFLILNNTVFVPVYNDPADEIALARLNQCFPQHEIIAINARPLIQQYGSLHCATMQVPLAALAEVGDG